MNKENTILAALLLLAVSSISSAANNAVVEWAPFVKIAGVSDQDLISAATKVHLDFLSIQPGFIKRELVKKSESEYADIVYWSTQKNAVTAGDKVKKCTVCVEYFKLMDMKSSETSGAGFSYYSIIKAW